MRTRSPSARRGESGSTSTRSTPGPNEGRSPTSTGRAWWRALAPGAPSLLLRRHPERPVQPDRLSVQHRVRDDLGGELAVLLRPAEPRGKRNPGAERLALLLGEGGEQGGVEEARRDRHDT